MQLSVIEKYPLFEKTQILSSVNMGVGSGGLCSPAFFHTWNKCSK